MLHSQRIKAIFWIIGSVLSFTIAMALTRTKFTSPEMSAWTIILMRSIFGLLYISPFIIKRGSRVLKTQSPKLQLMAVIFGSCSTTCTYYAYQNLPLSIATSIGLSFPLIVPMFTTLVLNERISALRWFAIAVGYLGVLCIVRPTVEGIEWAMGVALLANLFAAAAMVTTKKLAKTESTQTLLFYSGLALFTLAACANVFAWKSFGWKDGMWLALIGGAGVFSQYSLISALRLESPSFIAPFQYFRLLLALAIDFFLFGEVLTPVTVIGSLIIIASSYIVVQSGKSREQGESTQPQQIDQPKLAN